MRRIKHRVMVALSTLMLLAPAVPALAEDPGKIKQEAQQADLDSFFGSNYQYCDAQVLSDNWSTSLENAKATIGYKVRNGYDEMLDDVLTTARVAALQKDDRCYYDTSDEFDYNDAEALAEAWSIDVSEAKATISYKIGMGWEDQIRQAVSGEGDESGVAADSQQANIEAFFKSDYHYCDAAAIAESWSVSLSEAKAAIGYKVQAGFENQLPAMLSRATDEAREKGEFCWVQMEGLSESDIHSLAEAWKMSIEDASAHADFKLSIGNRAAINMVLTQ